MKKGQIFNTIKLTKPGKNVFDLSHNFKLSGNMGNLIPILNMEVVPGDKINLSCETMVRFAPLLAPVMHYFYVSVHYFFVANRTLWPNWENYITATPVGGNPPAFPVLTMGTSTYSDLCNYMGIPRPNGANPLLTEVVSALPFAAYQKIYNEYYRDQNMIAAQTDTLVDGTNQAEFAALTALRKRAWEHDYFTSALPFAQKGPAIEIPVLQNFEDVPVRLNTDEGMTAGDLLSEQLALPVDVPISADAAQMTFNEAIYAETSILTPTTPTTINELRTAFRLQEWAEKMARGGSRYVESILSHFGVRSSDKRLQRPEYITGVKTPVKISEVLNTTGTEDAPQGSMAGHGVAYVGSNYKGSYYCEEHGYVIGIMSIMPKTAYQQGIPKHFLKTQDYTQFFWPSFAHLGEQEILQKEVMAFNGVFPGDSTFGYTPRYAEYKYENDRTAGDFQTSLNFWTATRIFDPLTPPQLNEDFINMNSADVDRIFAVNDPDVHKLWMQVQNNVYAVRPMPKFGTPTF